MASVSVEEITEVIVRERKYTLTLTQREAEALYITCQYVGGPQSSYRGDISNIGDSLENIDSIRQKVGYPIYKDYIKNDEHAGFSFKG